MNKIDRQYNEVLQKFQTNKGILTPIYATLAAPYNSFQDASKLLDAVLSYACDKSLNINDSHAPVGYFAAVKHNPLVGVHFVVVSYSLCNPEDYGQYNAKLGKLIAMQRALEGCSHRLGPDIYTSEDQIIQKQWNFVRMSKTNSDEIAANAVKYSRYQSHGAFRAPHIYIFSEHMTVHGQYDAFIDRVKKYFKIDLTAINLYVTEDQKPVEATVASKEPESLVDGFNH